MSKISDKKLKAPFEPFNALDLDYVQKAKKAAIQFQENGKIDQNLLIEIRNSAVNDMKHLKGDFVISMMIELQKDKKNFKGGGKKGRTILLKSQQEKVFKDLENGKSVALIAEDLSVSAGVIYRLIKNNKK